MRHLAVVEACLLALTAAASHGGEGVAFIVTSPAFEPGSGIPRDFTADGRNLSPALSWANPPAGCQAFALVCDDPDAPAGTWVHWLIWNLPGSATGIPQGLPARMTLEDGSVQGTNDFGRIGYGGPSPPRGKPHRYFFRLYALAEKLSLQAGASRKDLEKAMGGRILGTAELVGTYQR
jgi:Raf kinase inhibitor-like YbhB/YbcL family protein